MIPIASAAAAAALIVENLLLEHIKIGDIIVSACTGLSGSSELLITEKRIGAGYAITDAAVKVPTEKTIDICFAPPQYSAEAVAAALITGEVDSLTESWQDKRDALHDLQSNRELITLQTHENSYNNMIIRVIDPLFDSVENWNAFFATVTLRQINPVSSDGGGGIVDSELADAGAL